MGKKAIAGETDSTDSDLRYFAKVQEQIRNRGTGKEVAFAEAFGQTVARARGRGSMVLVHAIVARILRQEEIEHNTGPFYVAATQAASAALRGRWDQVEALRNKYATGSEAMDKIFQIFGF
jgi:hypothetical protein